MIYGYIRVSTDKQDCDNQKLGIENKAASLGLKIDKYIEDAGISGTKEPEQRALGGCLKKLKAGDVLICSELSRLGRKLFMIMRILEHCMKCGAKVYTVKDGYELGDNIQSKVMAFAFGLSAEIERDLISQRTKEALLKLKKQGKKLGREAGSKNKKRKLDDKIEIINDLLIKKVPKIQIAKKLKETYPDINYIAVESRTTTCAEGMLVKVAVEMRDSGATAETTAKFIEENKCKIQHFIVVEDLMYLKRGGRISGVSAAVGSLLKIKPIIEFTNEGKLEIVRKEMGTKKAFRSIIEEVKGYTPNSQHFKCVIVHTDNLDGAKELQSLIKQELGYEPEIRIMGPIIGAHVGPNAVAFAFISSTWTIRF